MRKLNLLLSVMIFTFVGVQTVKSQVNSFIKKIELDLSKDSLTNLNRKAIVSEFYIGWSVNDKGIIDTAGQFINIYCNVVILDINGNPVDGISERKVINIKQGTPEFENWFGAFDNTFKDGVIGEMQLHKSELEEKTINFK